jgi:hypothetical protein
MKRVHSFCMFSIIKLITWFILRVKTKAKYFWLRAFRTLVMFL